MGKLARRFARRFGRGRSDPVEETYFFTHVMKTSGTSFNFYLLQALGRDTVFPVRNEAEPLDVHVERRIALGELRAAASRSAFRAFSGHYPAFGADVVGATRTVTVLRDPVERSISMLKQHQRLHAPDRTLEEVYADPDVFARFIDNHQTKVFSLREADELPSVFGVIRVDGARLDAAKERLARIDVVGVQEDHAALLEAAQRTFGWPPPSQQRWGFRSKQVEVPAGLRERIAEDNPYDMELYDWVVREVAAGRPLR